jgi:hypothetical protein
LGNIFGEYIAGDGSRYDQQLGVISADKLFKRIVITRFEAGDKFLIVNGQ